MALLVAPGAGRGALRNRPGPAGRRYGRRRANDAHRKHACPSVLRCCYCRRRGR